MTTSPPQPTPTTSVHSALITCDPDFVLSDRPSRYRLPMWLMLAVAVTTACATAAASRHA
ncbi:hypothetical protein CFK39_12215 [Brachybacterium avium]|uniref:Uncharacterized protein n=1 Tax=Brachybacterium avium TaxID=2017485 RepID=A0A220UE05_9MICO|nr:hypothetical protein [Brachybacterium avium]ASK66454.1 hypothetical protein CFK39_12215 [Brachybacterium avium]